MGYYTCTYCKKEFAFPEEISFCPFCGAVLHNTENRDMDALQVEQFGDITEGLDVIRNVIEGYIEMMMEKALWEIRVSEGKMLGYDFFEMMNECLEAQSTEAFFTKVDKALEKLDKLIGKKPKQSQEPQDGEGIFGKFYEILGRMDETLLELLKSFSRIPQADLPEEIKSFPVMRFDTEIKVEDISEETCRSLLTLLRQLLVKLQRYVEENHLYFHYFGDADLICEDFDKNAENTEAALTEAIQRKLVYDILEEDNAYEELLSVFWNGFYQLSVYAERNVELAYFYNGRPCDPKHLIEVKLKKHYRFILTTLMSVEWAMKKEGPWAIRNYWLNDVRPILRSAIERESWEDERERNGQ